MHSLIHDKYINFYTNLLDYLNKNEQIKIDYVKNLKNSLCYAHVNAVVN